ncbi:MAG TPA: hypothetical protein VGD40_18910 [Chryseosolibacter sp.]
MSAWAKDLYAHPLCASLRERWKWKPRSCVGYWAMARGVATDSATRAVVSAGEGARTSFKYYVLRTMFVRFPIHRTTVSPDFRDIVHRLLAAWSLKLAALVRRNISSELIGCV